jgi:hypothetical protein
MHSSRFHKPCLHLGRRLRRATIQAGGGLEGPSPNIASRQLPGVGLLFCTKMELQPDATVEVEWSPGRAKASRQWLHEGLLKSGYTWQHPIGVLRRLLYTVID